MKKYTLLFLIVIILLLPACITVNMPGSTDNTPPTAYIDSILPAQAAAGASVSFNGHGTDPDGSIVGYEWRSDRDGMLSTAASFTTSSLSTGTHSITFRVLDSGNAWSSAAAGTVTIQTTVAAKPVIASFTASPGQIVPGGSAVLQWSVSGANTITIDNGIGNVNASGTRAVSPLQSTVYTLTAVNQGGSTTATAAVTMVQPTATGNPVIQFTATHLGGTSWRLNWQVTNATQAVIEPEIGSVNFTGSTTVTSPSGQLKTYRLTAHNSWGGWAYHEVILGSP